MTPEGLSEEDRARVEALLGFWFGRPGEPEFDRPRKIWFERDERFDAALRERFVDDCGRAARDAAAVAISRGHDVALPPVRRRFFYLPFTHSEDLRDQRRCCALMRTVRSAEGGEEAVWFAERHREIIERFGRFPHRNAILGRPSTPEEIEFLKQPGSGF